MTVHNPLALETFKAVITYKEGKAWTKGPAKDHKKELTLALEGMCGA